MSNQEGKRWFVLEEEREKSFSTVLETDVVFDDNVHVGDKVMFVWNKKNYTGKVCFISEDFEDCVAKSQELNSLQRKRSFDTKKSMTNDEVDSCRRTKSGRVSRQTSKSVPSFFPSWFSAQQSKAKKAKSNTQEKLPPGKKAAMEATAIKRILDAKVKAKKNDDTSSETQTNEPDKKKMFDVKAKGKKQNRNISTSSSASSSDDSSQDTFEKTTDGDQMHLSDDSSLSGLSDLDEESAFRLRKLAAKLAAKTQNQKLKEMASQGYLPSSSSCKKDMLINKDELNTNRATAAGASDLDGDESNIFSATHEEIKKDKHENTMCSSVAGNEVSLGKKQVSEVNNYVPNTAGMEAPIPISMFLIIDPSKTPSVELKDEEGNGTGIFCAKRDYDYASTAASPTMVGRRLLTGVFTMEALTSCSVSGLPPRGKGKEFYKNAASVKKLLDRDGVDAIVGQALEWLHTKKLRPKVSSKQIRSAMAVRLCELADKQAAMHKE